MKFKTLWENFPDKSTVSSRCFNKQKASEKPFGNYCAILLSESFIKSGINITSLSGKRCWSHAGMKHLLLAEDFANSLKGKVIPGIESFQKIQPESFQLTLKEKTGIIYFKDYWQRGRESFEQRSGDHIDLWNKNEITSSGMFIRSILEFFGRVSDLNKSREVWFWEVK
ncbi:hypothetical protein FKG94_08470 [Exilibacterium tricleocarpae]|uniref:Uncharacterized protein n=1 Tax=Exilibacterium tricleocarpae TaxID=2591008 RepID=A0A545TV84_9GAMM|nr:T6SS effector amidase Tae4 family protein [Exilibacterium tricleocarpae]TQV81135.1 hypothetical protein FKG94_08470 [Exilibacterium tricleocarpae]